jgi:hypothetical protein
MRDMTDEEYDALDERLTKADLKVDHSKKGFFTRESSRVVFLKNETADLLDAKAAASNQTPSDYIDSMLRKEAAVSQQ